MRKKEFRIIKISCWNFVVMNDFWVHVSEQKIFSLRHLTQKFLGSRMVVPAGLEPATSNEAWILNPLCKPIPPGNH